MKKLIAIILFATILNTAIAGQYACTDCAASNNNNKSITLANISRSIASKIKVDRFTAEDACMAMAARNNAAEVVEILAEEEIDVFKYYSSITCKVYDRNSTLLAEAVRTGQVATFKNFLGRAKKSGIENLKNILETKDSRGRTILEFVEYMQENTQHGSNRYKNMEAFRSSINHYQNIINQAA